jgi:hypothetical protein
MACTMAPTTASAMGSVPVAKAGVGSAVINSMRQVGGSIGIAVMGAIFATQLEVLPGNPRYVEQFVAGYHLGLNVAAALALAGAVVAVLTIRPVHHAVETRIAEPVPSGSGSR